MMNAKNFKKMNDCDLDIGSAVPLPNLRVCSKLATTTPICKNLSVLVFMFHRLL